MGIRTAAVERLAAHPAQRRRPKGRRCGAASLTFDKANEQRGYHAVYRADERNHCPGCGREHWIIGRKLAECAFCGTALPLREDNRTAAPTIMHWSGRRREFSGLNEG